MLGWLCLVIPGWLYCASRHLLRSKACARCGGMSLMRESRAATRRHREDWGAETSIINLNGPVHWPRALVKPRERLRRGSVGALLATAAFACGLHAVLRPGSELAMLAADVLSVLGVSWLLHGLITVVWMHLSKPRCRAWRADGRPLRIEAF